VEVIPNGVCPHPTGESDILKRSGLAPQQYVLFVGRLSEEKGCHQLIEAFQQAHTDGFRLVFAGGATYAPSYAAELRAMAGPDVCFLGWVDQAGLAELYANCALFVLPSSLEGLSVALLEAMSHGAPSLRATSRPMWRPWVTQAGSSTMVTGRSLASGCRSFWPVRARCGASACRRCDARPRRSAGTGPWSGSKGSTIRSSTHTGSLL